MIIPAIDLIDGSVVRLYQGDYQQQTSYTTNPIELVKDYAEQGAKWLHIVDLTGAKDTSQRQLALIGDMVKAANMRFQAGGGIRTEHDVKQLLDIGVSRVVIGSLAVGEPERVKCWMQTYGPEKIVLALDINIDHEGNKRIATHGWQQDSGVELDSLVQDFLTAGLQHVLCTDISKDGTLQGPNTDLYKDLASNYPQISWQTSGGMSCLSDVTSLKPLIQNAGTDNSTPSGIILGRALLEGKFTVKQAIDCWQKNQYHR